MWTEFFRFDLRSHLRQPLLWVFALPLAALAFLSASDDGFRLGGAIGSIHMNAPTVIANRLSVLSIIAMFLVTVFIAGAVLRDQEVGIADVLFSSPMRKTDYLLGRFLAGFVACLVLFALVTVAMMAGSRMPSIDPARIGPFAWFPYAWSFCVFVVPNILFIAALLTLLAVTTRSLILVYLGVLALMVLWSVAGLLGAEGLRASPWVLLDPFGVRALSQATRYYSGAQANTLLPALSGLLLLNRLLWAGLSLGMVGATVALFEPQRAGTRSGRPGKPASPPARAPAPRTPARVVAAPRFTPGTALAQGWALLRFDAKGIFRSYPFLVMLLLALANFVANFIIGGRRLDSVPYPLTRLLLDEVSGGVGPVLMLAIIFFSGELAFRERQAKVAEVTDAMPVPSWLPLLAKACALTAVVLAFLCSGAALAIGIQLVKGGAPVEGWLYVEGTLIASAYYILAGLAMLALHVLANNKFLGYPLAIALLASDPLLASFGFAHRLYRFASLPPLPYSDMNGYGDLLLGWGWSVAYWAAFTAALLVVATSLWHRGFTGGWRARCASAAHRLQGRTGAALALCLAAFAATGGWIFYNTNVLNRYLPDGAALDARAAYEKKHRDTLALPNPSLVQVRADVDIFPAQREVLIKGRYVLQNKTRVALDALRFQLAPDVATTLEDLPAHTVTLDDPNEGFRVIRLAAPLAPGATVALGFTVHVRSLGFTNGGAPGAIQRNGTMFTSEDYFPKLGYVQAMQLDDRSERRKRGLGEPHRMPKLEDPAARDHNYWKLYGFDADQVDFETTVSTSADQVALAPGRLEQSWEREGRRYFHYKMETPILPSFSYQSARWLVRTAAWRDLPIEVYYDPKHPYNIDSMIKGTQAALDYNTANFGPAETKRVRVVETPLYQPYARSFPNIIPFSESLGFISDLRAPDSVDHVFYVTAHEVAHDWWGDQAIAANVQGSGMVTETLAEYSALMVFEKAFGAEKVRHILRYDLDRYLAGRGSELVEEQPLYRTENQVYLQYRKGSLVLYRLRDEIGEAAVNRALRRFLEHARQQRRPYVTSADLLGYLRDETPADKQSLLTDLFERIVLYDNRVLEARATRLENGRWEVTMKVSLAKLESDGKGKETERAYDEPIDLAIFARGPRNPGSSQETSRVLFREKRRLPAGLSTLTIEVPEEPFEASLDPDTLLIDRVVSDNRKEIELRN